MCYRPEKRIETPIDQGPNTEPSRLRCDDKRECCAVSLALVSCRTSWPLELFVTKVCKTHLKRFWYTYTRAERKTQEQIIVTDLLRIMCYFVSFVLAVNEHLRL